MARVLVVDDDQEILNSCVRKLERRGHQVDGFHDPVEALDFFRSAKPFDCLLVDLRMPVMDGATFVRHATRHDPDVVSIAMTALATVDAATIIAESGARFFLAKPFRTGDMLRVIERAAERTRVRRERQRLIGRDEEGSEPVGKAGVDGTTILEHLFDGILFVDMRGNLLMRNSAARTILGDYMLGSGLGRYEAVILHPELTELIRESLIGRDEGVRVRRSEITIENRTYVVDVTRIVGRDDKSSGIVLALHDISEIRRLRQVESRFVTLAANELKGPLQAVDGYFNLFMGSGIPLSEEKRLSVLGRIRERMAEMRKLIDALVTFNRARTETTELRRERIDIAVILEDAITEAITQRGDRDITLRREYTNATAYVNGDGDALVRMFAEIIGNAFKFNRDGGEVRVILFPDEKTHEVYVADTGIGIPEDDLAGIFEEFVRVKHPSTIGIRGSGLGLSIARRIAESHMGRIQVVSTLGEGSQFTVYLPAADDAGGGGQR